MMEPSTSTQTFNESDNIDLLDVLVIISKRKKLIIFLTVLGATIGWLWAQMAPIIYSSTSSLNVEAWKAEENAPQFKTEIIASLVNTNQKIHELLQDESWGAHAEITASTNPKDRLLIVTTSAFTPEKSTQDYSFNYPLYSKYHFITMQHFNENQNKLRTISKSIGIL